MEDFGNNRVKIVSFERQFINTFGQEMLKSPWGIAVTNEHVYITDEGLHALFQLDKNSYQLVRRTGTKGSNDGQFNYLLGLTSVYNNFCISF